MFGYSDFKWKGNKLLVANKNTGAKILPDAKWPGMFRVEFPPGTLSDTANLTRAKDAAISIIAQHLNSEARRTAIGAPPMSLTEASSLGAA